MLVESYLSRSEAEGEVGEKAIRPQSEQRASFRKVKGVGWGVFVTGSQVALGLGSTQRAAVLDARKHLTAALSGAFDTIAGDHAPDALRDKWAAQLSAVEVLGRFVPEGE